MKKQGRKAIEFDSKQVELLGKFKATYKTCADWFECSVETIQNRMKDSESNFYKIYNKAFINTKMKISEMQIKKALEGNVSLLIWLGKVYLNQSELPDVSENHNLDSQITSLEYL